MEYFSTMDFTRSVIVLSITYLLIMMGFGEMAPILGFTLAFAFFMPLIYTPIFIKKVFPKFLHLKAKLDFDLAWKLIAFGIPVMFTNLAGVIFTHTDSVILTHFRSLTEVGLYNVAAPTTKLIKVIGVALTAVILPMVSELWIKNKRRPIGKGIGMLYKYVLMVVFPIAILLFLFPDSILRILFGNDYVPASNTLRILTISSIVMIFANINNFALTGIGKPKVVGKIMMTGAIVNLLLNIIMIPNYGTEGAAISTLFALTLIFMLSIINIRGYVSFDLPWKDFIIIILSGVPISIFAQFLRGIESIDVWLKIIITAFVGIGLYCAVLLLSRTLIISDVKRIIKGVI